MDKRRKILASAVAMLVITLYLGLNWYLRSKYPHYFEPPPQEAAKTEAPAAAPPATAPAGTSPADAPGTAPSVPATGPTTAPAGPAVTAAPAAAAALQVINQPQNPEKAAIGSVTRDDKNWPMYLRVAPLGAGIEEVILNGYYHAADYRKPEKDRRAYSFQEPYGEYPDTRPLATRWVEVNGTRLDTGWANWTKV